MEAGNPRQGHRKSSFIWSVSRGTSPIWREKQLFYLEKHLLYLFRIFLYMCVYIYICERTWKSFENLTFLFPHHSHLLLSPTAKKPGDPGLYTLFRHQNLESYKPKEQSFHNLQANWGTTVKGECFETNAQAHQERFTKRSLLQFQCPL